MSEAGSLFFSTVVDAPLEKIWPLIRVFDKVPAVGTIIPGSVVILNDKGVTELGVQRQINLPEGQYVIETLVELNDTDHIIGYVIDSVSEKAFPGSVENYSAQFQLLPVTEGNRTYWKWTANWTGTNTAATRDAIYGLFKVILGALEKDVKA